MSNSFACPTWILSPFHTSIPIVIIFDFDCDFVFNVDCDFKFDCEMFISIACPIAIGSAISFCFSFLFPIWLRL